jgi:Fic family protein
LGRIGYYSAIAEDRGLIVLSLDPTRILETPIPVSTGWLLGSCMEARGRQDSWIKQKPEVLDALREQAVIQSVESSNRIEGVTVPPERLRPVVLGKVKPRDRPEEELAGYRQALDWVLSCAPDMVVTPSVIQRLHFLAQGGDSGDAGRWKARDNEIIEILPNGERRVRFVPTPARDVPSAMDSLCLGYRQACAEARVPGLLVVATFVLDLLCIHPFRDGNGRVSRLATTLMLEAHGYSVGRYISLERHVEETKEDYYRVLERCSRGWDEGSNELVLWWNYFLGVVYRAYKELERHVESVDARPAKTGIARQTILAQVGPFTLGDLVSQMPGTSPQLVKKVLAELKRQGRVGLTGRGRGARWEVVP